MVLTKAAFMRKQYLEMYHDGKVQPKAILEHFDANRNCKDIPMAFMVARRTGTSPRAGGHEGIRDQCLRTFSYI